MAPSIATASHSEPRTTPPASIGERADRRLEGLGTARVAVGLAAFALLVYFVSNPIHHNLYAHYVWQADAWLHGRFAISWPVSEAPLPNDHYRDVLPVPGHPGLGQTPYPPLPAIVLLPFVAVLGLRVDAQFLGAVIGAANAGLAWLIARRLAGRPSVALLAALFFSFGTVAWVAAARASTWYLAHDVALLFGLLAVLAVLDARRTRAAFLLGLATLARLTVFFGVPLLLLNGRDPPWRRLGATFLGLAPPLLFLVVYNLASSGQLMQPGYAQLYQTEMEPIEGLYHRDWGIVDPRYLPQNLAIMLLQPPLPSEQCALLPIARDCDPRTTLTLAPNELGMSLLLSSPGWLLAIAALRRPRTDLVIGCALAIGAVALVDLMHFSQGWVQFGYRFSNDWAPFGLVLLTLGIDRLGLRRWVVALVGLSILVNLWGVAWAAVFGW